MFHNWFPDQAQDLLESGDWFSSAFGKTVTQMNEMSPRTYRIRQNLAGPVNNPEKIDRGRSAGPNLMPITNSSEDTQPTGYDKNLKFMEEQKTEFLKK